MKVYGPYLARKGTCKGRRLVTVRYDDGTKRTLLYSRFLMEEKLGRRLEKHEHVDHIDEDKTNDKIENLQILAPVANIVKSNHARKAAGWIHPLKGTEKGWTHGTMTGWLKKKCACDLCAARKIADEDKRNAKRRAGNGVRGKYRKEHAHGTTTMYRLGCRCDLCRAHSAKRARDLRARKLLGV